MNPNDDTVLKLDQQLCFPLYAATNLLGRLYRPLLSGLGLTYPQYLVMLVLWESGPLSVGELGVRLYLDSGTLTPLLKRLELAGFVVRERAVADERRVEISLTAAGKALQTRAVEVPKALFCMLGLDPESGIRLRHGVKEFVARLEHALEVQSSHGQGEVK